jgi:hypothetical protein
MIEKYPAIPEIAKAVPNNIDANIIIQILLGLFENSAKLVLLIFSHWSAVPVIGKYLVLPG